MFKIDTGDELIKTIRIMTNMLNSIEIRIDDDWRLLFEELSGMILRIRLEKNQIDTTYILLKKPRDNIWNDRF
jgi:hypothetical protein